ncbi:hypothetical protein KKY_465 [Pelagibacterium halotolerans B2]|uniref:Uncharacterized protein n=1 Tax=Pelagibacterium halotolerans (strain DSM 22347 / JCM 15775 / CGMCC 1.7692 / B2) TaxID=1082931 RepID=G4RAE7_PELHB|nr:hypothetical protein KKY_465 [Pelagibacterium halotolerans B2]
MHKRDTLTPLVENGGHGRTRPLGRTFDQQQIHICVRRGSITHQAVTPCQMKAELNESLSIH